MNLASPTRAFRAGSPSLYSLRTLGLSFICLNTVPTTEHSTPSSTSRMDSTGASGHRCSAAFFTSGRSWESRMK